MEINGRAKQQTSILHREYAATVMLRSSGNGGRLSIRERLDRQEMNQNICCKDCIDQRIPCKSRNAGSATRTRICLDL